MGSGADRNGHREERISTTADLYVGRSDRHGRAVFAARAFDAGDVVERCPVIPLSSDEHTMLERTALNGYLYEWDGGVALALGFGSFYNHSSAPSAEYELLEDEDLVCIRALRPIAAGEEITICYADEDDLWFEPVEAGRGARN